MHQQQQQQQQKPGNSTQLCQVVNMSVASVYFQLNNSLFSNVKKQAKSRKNKNNLTK